MSSSRIWAVIWRHLYNFKHSWDRLGDAFYWPAMDIFIWGLTSNYIQENSTEMPMLLTAILSGLVLWQVIWRGQYEVTINLLEEMWSTNLVNIFSTPLNVYEWIVAVMILGFVKLIMTVGFAILLVMTLYSVKFFSFGWLLIPFLAVLLMVGWIMGFFVAGLLINFGKRIQTIAWTGVYLLSPFSAVFYPVSSLPEWAQKISHWIPSSYVFEGMRSVLLTGKMDQVNLIKSGVMSGAMLLVSMLFFVVMFNMSRKKGLSSLE